MKRFFAIILAAMLAVNLTFAMHCPDPQNSSLAWGEIPAPWELSPFSPGYPQADDTMQFVQANILRAGYGQGVSCSYRHRAGSFTLWQQGRTKLPSRQNPYWMATPGGYVCNVSLEDCVFLIL